MLPIEYKSNNRQLSMWWVWMFHNAHTRFHGSRAGASGTNMPAEPGLQGQPSPGNCWLWGKSIPLFSHAGSFLVFCHLFSGTENSGNKIPFLDSRPIQLQIPLCLCQQCTPKAELEKVAASKSLLLFTPNFPSDSSFRMKLLTLSLSSKDLFRSC